MYTSPQRSNVLSIWLVTKVFAHRGGQSDLELQRQFSDESKILSIYIFWNRVVSYIYLYILDTVAIVAQALAQGLAATSYELEVSWRPEGIKILQISFESL